LELLYQTGVRFFFLGGITTAAAKRSPASMTPESDHHLYAGGQSSKARSRDQAGEDGHEKDHFSLTGPTWTMKKNDFTEVL
jgi:hypothetical protein